ncbi:MAG: NYN domain-containing protein [Opitutales bacterium]|jgi:predicted RNA-binding protein with PIN domain
MIKRLILVDACNLVHRLAEDKKIPGSGMDTLARQLLEELRPLHDLENWELHLVVDGNGTTMVQQFPDNSKTLSMIFTPRGQTADTIIETWLLKLGRDWSVRVATEDRAIQYTALATGAEVLSARELVDWNNRVRERFSQRQSKLSKESSSQFGNRLDGLL